MSHPKDRRERFLVGLQNGRRRAKGLLHTSNPTEETMRFFSYILRSTTKRCSCDMCGNPRHVAWDKKDKLTIQERRLEDWRFE